MEDEIPAFGSRHRMKDHTLNMRTRRWEFLSGNEGSSLAADCITGLSATSNDCVHHKSAPRKPLHSINLWFSLVKSTVFCYSMRSYIRDRNSLPAPTDQSSGHE